MASVYFLMDGEGTKEARPRMEIKLPDLLQKFGSSLMFLNESDVSVARNPSSQYEKWVVIQISQGEAEGVPHLRPGFYVLDAVHIEKFRATFG